MFEPSTMYSMRIGGGGGGCTFTEQNGRLMLPLEKKQYTLTRALHNTDSLKHDTSCMNKQ